MREHAQYPGFELRATHLIGLIGFSLTFSACIAQDRTDAVKGRQLLGEASQALVAKDYAQAADKAQQAAELELQNAAMQQRAAEIVFLSGKPAESLKLFDRVIKLAPETAPENWQRGIALCCVGKFEEGEKQFATHHRVNPDDVENSAWHFLCVAKTKGIEAARKSVIPSRGDGREPMMSVLKMLQDKISPDKVLEAATANTPEGNERKLATFYGSLYVALYFDSIGEKEKAIAEFKRCLAVGEQGYMADTARVYLASRFPDSGATRSNGK